MLALHVGRKWSRLGVDGACGQDSAGAVTRTRNFDCDQLHLTPCRVLGPVFRCPAAKRNGHEVVPPSGSGLGTGWLPDGMSASSSVVEPAGRVTASWVRSRRRSSDSPSPRGIVASIRALACTSGRSMTASTRLARRPGGTCPAGVCSDARTVPSAPSRVVTSAAAAGWPSSPTSTCRGPSGSVMAVPPGIVRLYLRRRAEPGPIRLGLALTARTPNSSTATDLAAIPVPRPTGLKRTHLDRGDQ